MYDASLIPCSSGNSFHGQDCWMTPLSSLCVLFAWHETGSKISAKQTFHSSGFACRTYHILRIIFIYLLWPHSRLWLHPLEGSSRVDSNARSTSKISDIVFQVMAEWRIAWIASKRLRLSPLAWYCSIHYPPDLWWAFLPMSITAVSSEWVIVSLDMPRTMHRIC
jgi:hypothetical protein